MFQICCEKIIKLKNTPSNLLTTDVDIFGEKIVIDEVHKSLLMLRTSDMILFNKIISALLSSIESVIQRQMLNYISGPLSNPTEKILKDTLSAPANNMHAERALGMTDILIRKAPNATIGYLDSKVKAKLNHTLEWIESKPEDIQRKLIQFSITRGAQIRKAGVVENKEIDDNIKLRRIEASQKANNASRKKLEQDIKKVILNNASADNELFTKVVPSQKAFLEKMLSGQSMTDHLFNHKWELDNGQDKIFYGRILTERQKDKRTVYVTSYWGFEEDSSEDFDIFIESIIADMLLGDLFFEV
ncbi:Transmembrane protein [Biomphalaria glabrata]|nr:Transmembrane protein [Biomphalaria glabrata]